MVVAYSECIPGRFVVCSARGMVKVMFTCCLRRALPGVTVLAAVRLLDLFSVQSFQSLVQRQKSEREVKKVHGGKRGLSTGSLTD